MIDAARLAMPLGDGDILWRPANLADIESIPSRTLLLFDFYRLGTIARQQPWSWWRVKGKRAMAHQYTTDWQARPLPPARCGQEPDGALERYEVGKCTRCERLDRGEEAPQPTGTVGGVRVGAGNVLRRDQRAR